MHLHGGHARRTILRTHGKAGRHLAALSLNLLGFKLLVIGGAVLPYPTHDGTDDRIGVKAGAWKGGKRVVGFQKAVAEIANLCLEAVNVVCVHGYSIARAMVVST